MSIGNGKVVDWRDLVHVQLPIRFKYAARIDRVHPQDIVQRVDPEIPKASVPGNLRMRREGTHRVGR